MEINGLVTLMTDFGTRDPYVGIMKGVILSANPKASVIDITHEITAHSIFGGAYTFANAYRYFPEGTIHVVIVDPGVGSDRKAIAVLTDRYIFIGPDNGILSLSFNRENIREIREITNMPFRSENVSNTFHGRDIFAPCAGQLSLGASFEEIGPALGKIKRLEYPHPTIDGGNLKGEVITIDSFGNIITNISRRKFYSFSGNRPVEIYFGTHRFDSVKSNYASVPEGSSLVVFGSSDYMEISMNKGNAADYFMTSVGNPVIVRRT